jgi:CRISPR/Cas system-associated exonuclease Cas4 (RecB family)
MIVSPTAINTFLECPYKYYLAYEKLATPLYKPAYEFGRKIHSVIAEYYRSLPQYLTPNEVPMYLSIAVKKVGIDAETYKRYLDNFVAFEKQRLSWNINPKPLAIEKEIVKRPFKGIIDAMFKKGNETVIVDWKTGFTRQNPIRDEQLMIQGNIYLYLTDAKELYFIFLSYGHYEKIEYNESFLRSRIVKFLDAIKTRSFPKVLDERCRNCEFNAHCLLEEYKLKWWEL